MRPGRQTGGQPGPSLVLVGTYVQIIRGKGARLKKRRKDRGLTQAQLGFLCDQTSQATISYLENERMTTCTHELALQICKYLDLEVEDIFEVRGGTDVSTVTTDTQASRRRPGRRGGRQRPPRTELGSAA